MLKRLSLTGAFVALSTASFAQYESLDLSTTDLTNEQVRFTSAYIGEPVENPFNEVASYTSVMQMQYSSQNWKDVRDAVLWLEKNAPIATPGLYSRGAYALGMLISSTENVEEKKTYLDEMMHLFDTRLKYLKYLNAGVAEGKKGRATEGDVLINKANYFHIYGRGVSDLYTYNTIYDMYKKGMEKINEEGGREVRGVYIQYFYSISDELFKLDNNAYREQYLNDYLESKEVCEKMLQMAKEVDDSALAQKIVQEYDQPLAVIETLFANSGAANRDQLIALYTPLVEKNKDNVNYLRSAMTVLSSNGCDDTDVYYAAARYAYAIEPTFESAIGLAAVAKKEGKQEEMLSYYNKALELAKNDKTRASISFTIGQNLVRNKEYTGAGVYLNKAVDLNPDLKGKVLYTKAGMATALGQYAEAIALCNEASEADVTVSGQASRLAEQIKKFQADTAANARKQKEYDEYMAKKKAEEDFWKAGK